MPGCRTGQSDRVVTFRDYSGLGSKVSLMCWLLWPRLQEGEMKAPHTWCVLGVTVYACAPSLGQGNELLGASELLSVTVLMAFVHPIAP